MQSFAGVRKDSLFFTPFFSNSIITIPSKILFYFLIIVGDVAAVGFSMADLSLLYFIPFFLFMMFYRHRGVHMEFVLSSVIHHYGFSKKKTKQKSSQKSTQNTLPIFGADAVPTSEITDSQKQLEKKEKTLTARSFDVSDPDYPIDLVLNVGLAYRLQHVVIFADKKRIMTHSVDSKGMVQFTLIPEDMVDHPVLIEVKTPNDELIATEKINFVFKGSIET